MDDVLILASRLCGCGFGHVLVGSCPRMVVGAHGERLGFHDWSMAKMERDKLFTPEELSSYLNVPVATLYDWRYRGGGPPGFRLGRHLRYRKAEVDRWIEDRIQAASPSRR